MTYTFTIPLAPEAAPKHCTRWKTAGGLQRYQNPKGAQWRLAVASCASHALAGVRLEGPLQVDIVAVFPRPKYLLKLHGRGPLKGAPVHSPGRIWHDKKPDRDNIDKGILDGLKAYWGDDCQVCCGEVLKVYAAMDELPHVEVRISEAPSVQDYFDDHGLPLPYSVPVAVTSCNGGFEARIPDLMRGVPTPGVVSGRGAGMTDEDIAFLRGQKWP